ncbi:MAG: 50S ribosomal protein L13 [Parcubacteria group bacterium]|nr:50S ribosomal protein L13 [Parcubacteria group bacterium]
MKYTIDAKGKKIGRVASAAAALLMGKARSDFTKNRILDLEVEIVNAGALFISLAKQKKKLYKHYTGYHGGLKQESFEKVVLRHGIAEPLKHAVYGMLPANRLRKERMKRLKITE